MRAATPILVLLALFPIPRAPLVGQGIADSAKTGFIALRIPVSITLRSMTESQAAIRLRVAGTFTLREFTTLDDIDLGSLRNTAVLAGVELWVPLHRYRTLRPFLDMGVGEDVATGEPVFLIEGGMLAEFIFPWRRWFLSVEPAVRFNGKSGNELGPTDDQVNALLHVEGRYPMPWAIAGNGMFAGPYAEAGYFLNSLDFLSVTGTAVDAQEAFEVGLTLGFYDIRPKIWFIRLPRISVGYRFSRDVSGFRIRIGGDWATKVFTPDP